MMKDLWLPKGYELAEGIKIRSLLFAGEDWQIFSTHGGGSALVARPELAQRWCDTEFLQEALFERIAFGSTLFWSLNSPEKYVLRPVDDWKLPDSKVDAIAFSLALKESRSLSGDVSFHDSIYVERYSRLLPTWTLTPQVEDEVLLGTWITGGVIISTNSFRRLSNLVGWMPQSDLIEIIEAAGLHVPDQAGFLTRQQPASQDQSTRISKTADTAPSIPDPQHSRSRTFVLPGRSQLETFFNEHVIDIIFNAERYHALGIEFPSAIVLSGPPGCGKTFSVERLVEFIDWPSYSIDSNTIGSPYIHDTSKKISGVFDKAIDTAPSVIVIDEMESFLSDRSAAGAFNQYHIEEVAEFLRRIPEAIKHKVLIIGMTNKIDLIDPAILRRGRFDHIIEVGMPTRTEVESLLDSLLGKLPTSEDLDPTILINALTGRPLSDLDFVIREAARLAAKAGKSQLDQESIMRALTSLPDSSEKETKRIGFVID